MRLVLVLLVLGGCDAVEGEVIASDGGCAEQRTDDGVLVSLEELGPPVLSSLDLATGVEGTVFAVPSRGWAYEFDVRDGEVAMAYTRPPIDGEDGFDRSQIVLLEGDVAVPLAGEDVEGAWAFYPTWSSDGASVWFVASGVGTEADSMLAMVDVRSGVVRSVAANATEPAVSEGAVAWVAVDPESGARSLVLADAHGADPRVLVGGDDVGDLGQPFFSRDGAFVYFIVLESEVVDTPSLLDLLVPTAHAHASHDVTGDWWRVPVEGGAPERMSWLETIQYDGAAVDGGFVAATREGVVRVDGDGAVALRCTRTVRAVGISGR